MVEKEINCAWQTGGDGFFLIIKQASYKWMKITVVFVSRYLLRMCVRVCV